ncbi:isochorismatase family protein [Arthrobacter terrae]|uniref:isochorismatase family protein n=1 Tax=Arthrobacter terrae TaxID=2935737 RepID=UPI0028B1245A|nr:hypothetical protein [Arthrobacter terrae]
MTGAQTDACIRSTLHGAIIRGYDATLVSDAHTTEDQSEWGAPAPDLVIAHTNLYWQYERAPRRNRNHGLGRLRRDRELGRFGFQQPQTPFPGLGRAPAAALIVPGASW